MAWATPGGHFLGLGDRVVFVRDGGYDWMWQGTVIECLPENDRDDGEVQIHWDLTGGPLTTSRGPRIWYSPRWVEKIDTINILDRIVGEL